MLEILRQKTDPIFLPIVDYIWSNNSSFIHWPKVDFLSEPGRIRENKSSFSNNPAVKAFCQACEISKKDIPRREFNGKTRQKWSIHHIYDGKFPAPGKETTTHAASNPNFFTKSAGLVAIHPIADALADEVPYFAWLLRYEAFKRFNFDPDGVFTV